MVSARSFLCLLLLPVATFAGEEEYYRLVTVMTARSPTASRDRDWQPGAGIPLEVGGMTTLPDGRLAVAIRKGEVWLVAGADQDPPQLKLTQFASGLHEPLGLTPHGAGLATAQRSEITLLVDLDADGVADEYRTLARGWGVTGNYHEYAFGPKADGDGNLWVTLNLGLGLTDAQKKRTINKAKFGFQQGRWRGWGMRLSPSGQLEPMCAGMRSPSGLGSNAAGDMFYTDQQGNWVAAGALHQLKRGAFYHHPEALASAGLPMAPPTMDAKPESGLLLPAAYQRYRALSPPAVWFPYVKMGQSATDILLDTSAGKFGPFAGQLFIGEFTQAAIHRVFLEQVDGVYQGACFPFRRGFASAVLRLCQARDGSVFAGLTNRGWSSLGTASYGIQRLVWTGKTPFEIQEMRVRPDGFELLFTKPVMRNSAEDPASYRLSRFTYRYHASYGSEELERAVCALDAVRVSADGRRVQLVTSGLRPYFVHELEITGVRDEANRPLVHPRAYYTLNRIPSERGARAP